MILHSGLPRFGGILIWPLRHGFYEGSLPSGQDIVKEAFLISLKSGPISFYATVDKPLPVSRSVFQGGLASDLTFDYFDFETNS